jgi:integrase
MSCTVVTNRHGTLTFRIYFQSREYWKSTGKKDTPDNRRSVDALAVIISDAITKGTFSLDWFQEEEKREEPNRQTVGGYYLEWIKRMRPPVVRAGLERDYKDHFNWYILGKFEKVALVDVTPRALIEFRAYLLNERGLSLKSCRNVIDGSFRACIRDARQVDYLLDRDPFEALLWPRRQKPKPYPFTEAERDVIIAAFAKKSPFYVPFVYTLFWTGARPSELLALTWGDVDLRSGFIAINKSRYIENEGAPKTEGSDRQLKLLPSVVEVLKSLKPVHVTEKVLCF